MDHAEQVEVDERYLITISTVLGLDHGVLMHYDTDGYNMAGKIPILRYMVDNEELFSVSYNYEGGPEHHVLNILVEPFDDFPLLPDDDAKQAAAIIAKFLADRYDISKL